MVEPGYEKDQVTLAQMSDPPRLTRPARTPSTVRAPPLSPYRFTISLMESFEILTFSSLDSCLSRCRLHKACPGCSWVRFPPHLPSHLPRTQSDQRLEPRLRISWEPCTFNSHAVVRVSMKKTWSKVLFLSSVYLTCLGFVISQSKCFFKRM